jgi:pilus assembly protein CpaB
MRKGRSSLLLLVALVAGLGAAWVANNWIEQRAMTSDAAEDATTPVVVAALKIPFAQKIQRAHLKTVFMPDEMVQEGVFHEVEAVEGKVAKHIIFPGEAIIRERVADHAEGSVLSILVKQGMRAVTVRVNDVSGVAGFLLPGNRVDVLASRKVNQRSVTYTVLQNIKVLAVDQTASTDKDKPVVVRAVTLEVSPNDAKKLFKAEEEGNIQLILRNPLDQSINAEPVKKAAPVEKKSVMRRRPSPQTITVIRGTSMEKK